MRNRLKQILNTMDVPSLRKDLSKKSNLGWLLRNLRVRNGSHPSLAEAVELVKSSLREAR